MTIDLTAHVRVKSAPPTGASWAPLRDAAGIITNYAAVPARTWTPMPSTKMEDTIKPILDAGGYTLYQYGSNKLGAVMDNYSGMAWDFAKGRGWAFGGGHEGGSDNGVYQLDLNTMRWSVTAYPTHPTKDLTPEQLDVYGKGTRQPAAFDGSQATQLYPLAQSSTGFAAKLHSSFSILAWKAVPGPARWIKPEDVVYPNGDTFKQSASRPNEIPFPNFPNIADVGFDGRPLSRHTYGGTVYIPGHDVILNVVRSYWRCKLDGSGWVKIQDGGGKPALQQSGENIWTHVDEKTGKVWWGGCGSGCFDKGYYLYGQGYIVDPVTLIDEPTPGLLPGNRPPFEESALNAGDHQALSFKIGRRIGGWCVKKPGAPNPYGWTFNLDTGARELLRAVGTPFQGIIGEGNASIYIPHLGQEWVFNCDKSLKLPAWSIDIDDPKPGGPNGALDVMCRSETLANAAALPSNLNGLVYSRLSYWEKERLIVYCPATAQDVWVCRVP